MPKRDDIHHILIIGSGPIVIGQACEFDYSGTQACKALREEGYKVSLINSNPATIMTDPATADRTYIEPITPDAVEKIIIKEKPDAILPTLGGQTALNTAMKLVENGTLEKYGVEMIGATYDAIMRGEERDLFKKVMAEAGIETLRSYDVHDLTEAKRVAEEELAFPIIVRPSFTLGGTGGGIADNMDQLMEITEGGLKASLTTEVLLEESVFGWKEFEMEVMRDKKDNAVIICAIENMDPMGIHTGDSITVAPAQTLTDREYQIMRDASLKVLRVVGVETGGSNVQFCIHPDTGRMAIIEMNPRVSRSSALASKATGFPIAKLAAKLAVGYTLDELPNDIDELSLLSEGLNFDFSVKDLDDVLTDDELADMTGIQAIRDRVVQATGKTNPTVRDFMQKSGRGRLAHPVVGGPVELADHFEEWFTKPSADGFVIGGTHMPGAFEDFVEIVVPELQRRGLFRKEYTGTTLRDHIGAEMPERRTDRTPCRVDTCDDEQVGDAHDDLGGDLCVGVVEFHEQQLGQ